VNPPILPIDVYEPERWLDDALFLPEVRSAFANLVAMGWTDAVRKLHPDERIYTFWDYFRNAWILDAGLCIDHLLLSPSAAARLVSAGVDREVRGWERASDHGPTWIVIGNGAQSRAAQLQAEHRRVGDVRHRPRRPRAGCPHRLQRSITAPVGGPVSSVSTRRPRCALPL
jgi:hypothetical protein